MGEQTVTRDEFLREPEAVLDRVRDEGPVTVIGANGEPRGRVHSSHAVRPEDDFPRLRRLAALPDLDSAEVTADELREMLDAIDFANDCLAAAHKTGREMFDQRNEARTALDAATKRAEVAEAVVAAARALNDARLYLEAISGKPFSLKEEAPHQALRVYDEAAVPTSALGEEVGT